MTNAERPSILGAGLLMTLGPGVGLVIGLLGWGGNGIALGLCIGAGTGVILGADWDVLARAQARAGRRPTSSRPPSEA